MRLGARQFLANNQLQYLRNEVMAQCELLSSRYRGSSRAATMTPGTNPERARVMYDKPINHQLSPLERLGGCVFVRKIEPDVLSGANSLNPTYTMHTKCKPLNDPGRFLSVG